MALVVPDQIQEVLEPRERVVSVLQPHFDFDISKRITTRADPNQFNRLVDPSVYNQSKGEVPTFYEVYWDGEWICDFHSANTAQELTYVFLNGFYESYESGRVSFNEPEEEEKVDRLDEQLKKAKSMGDASIEEQISKQAIIETLEEKKAERDKSKKLLEDKL